TARRPELARVDHVAHRARRGHHGQRAGGRPATIFDDAWAKRLGISRRDFGIGMTTAEVTDLTRAIDLAALREYRDAVGRRTRELIAGFKDSDWGGELAGPDVQKAAA